MAQQGYTLDTYYRQQSVYSQPPLPQQPQQPQQQPQRYDQEMETYEFDGRNATRPTSLVVQRPQQPQQQRQRQEQQQQQQQQQQRQPRHQQSSSFPSSSASSMTISLEDDGDDDDSLKKGDLEKGASTSPHKKEDHARSHAHAHPHIDINDPNRPKLPLKQRMRHFTWAWFTLIMSTGGISLLLFAQPHQIPAFRQIGFVVWIITIILFILVVAGLAARFVLHPGTLKASLTHPREGFFVPTFFLSCATLITSTHRYGIPPDDAPLVGAIQSAFWGYVIVTLFLAVFQYSYVFSSHSFGLQTMMPTWILPIFPIMLSGTIASVIADTQPAVHAVPIVVGGLACQGLGMSVALIMYSHMVGRLMQTGLPHREHRPGLFMNVGPPSFTALAVIGMANGLPDNFDAGTGMAGVLDAAVLRTIAIVGAVFLWGLALWWFGVAVISVLLARPKYFHLGFWAMVFPNTGFVLATISLGNAFQSEPVLFVANAMSAVLISMYFLVLFLHIRAVMKQDIMYPGRDEDVEDH